MSNVSKFTIDNTAITVRDPNAVSVVANQGLTETQKANARTNIGAGASSFSGDYNDLTNKPTIGDGTLTIQMNGTNVQTFSANQTGNSTANVQVGKSDVGLGNVPNVATNDQTPTFTQASTRANIASGEKLSILFGKIMKWFADLKTVAFSGSYNDLSDKPTIPTVNNATLTIQKNGSNVQTFTANQSINATANITVPTKTSELTNDSGYTTNTGTVTQVKVGTTAYNPSSGVVSLPAYPTVNNGTLTIQKNGTNVQTFTANQSGNATANITVPTKPSDISAMPVMTGKQVSKTGVTIAAYGYTTVTIAHGIASGQSIIPYNVHVGGSIWANILDTQISGSNVTCMISNLSSASITISVVIDMLYWT